MTATAQIEINDQPLRQELQQFQQSASALRIVDQASYDLTSGLLQEVAAKRKKVVEFFRPMKQAADRAHAEICSREKEVLAPIQAIEQQLKTQISTWVCEQERLRREAERAAREEAERLAAEALERQIEDAESAGASVEEITAICEMPVAAPVPPPPLPTFTQNTAVSTRSRFKAEVTDVRELAGAVYGGQALKSALKQIVQHPGSAVEIAQAALRDHASGTSQQWHAPPTYITPNMTALNARARADGATMNIPGVRVVVESGVAVRSR